MLSCWVEFNGSDVQRGLFRKDVLVGRRMCYVDFAYEMEVNATYMNHMIYFLGDEGNLYRLEEDVGSCS